MGDDFSENISLDELLKTIRKSCVKLAGAETYTSVMEWYKMPIITLYEWADIILELQKKK